MSFSKVLDAFPFHVNPPPDTTNMSTVLEERLAREGGAELRISILERLSAMDQMIQQQISSGVSRHEYAEWQQMAKAANAAICIMTNYPLPTNPVDYLTDPLQMFQQPRRP